MAAAADSPPTPADPDVVDEASIAERGVGAIVGALIADAAAQPIHWIYDKEKLDEVLKDQLEAGLGPEFRPVSANPFYRLPTGSLSCYGDQAFLVLKHVAKHGTVDKDAYAEEVYAHFGGPDSPYDPLPTTVYHEQGTPSGKTKRYEREITWPIEGPWLHYSLKEFLKAVEEKRPWPQGPTDDKQVDGAAKVVAVAVRFAGKPELWTMVDQITRTTQNDETAVAATLLQAAILEQVLLGKPIGEAVALALAQRKAADRPCPAGGDAAVVAAVEEVLAEKPESTHEDILWAFGENCLLMNSIQTPVSLVTRAAPEETFEAVLRRTIGCIGCNCSRALVAGAIYGAAVGRRGLPATWVEKTTDGAEIVALAERVVGWRSS